MNTPPGWQNPILAPCGSTQKGVDPSELLPARPDLDQGRLQQQQQLLASGVAKLTPIQVNELGIIWDGHHAVRAAAEAGTKVDVLVISQALTAVGMLILDLP